MDETQQMVPTGFSQSTSGNSDAPLCTRANGEKVNKCGRTGLEMNPLLGNVTRHVTRNAGKRREIPANLD